MAAVAERLDAPLLSLTGEELTAELREDFACVQQLSARIRSSDHAATSCTDERDQDA